MTSRTQTLSKIKPIMDAIRLPLEGVISALDVKGNLRFIQIALLGILLSACSTPQQFEAPIPEKVLKQEQTEQFKLAIQHHNLERFRLAEVAHPLMRLSIPECRQRTRYTLGIFLHALHEYPKTQKAAAEAFFDQKAKTGTDAEKGVDVLYALKNGPSAGHLQQGDRILTINDETAPANTHDLQRALKAALTSGAAVSLEIRRLEQKRKVSITPVKVCDYAILLSRSDVINGYADGSRIIITSGLMRFAKEDNELALIIAHELAHNTLDHIPQRLSNTALGVLVDIAISAGGLPSPLIGAGLGANLFTEAYETEADLEGIRLLHQAGYDIEGLDLFWRKMAMLHPQSITHGPSISHPTTAERAIRIKAKIKELTSAQPDAEQ